jgi:hypothetical protein
MTEIFDDWNSDMDAFSDDFEDEQVTYEELLMEELDEEEELIGLGLIGGW